MRSARTLAIGLGWLLGPALAAGLAIPARADGCKGAREPDQTKIDQLRDAGRYDALEQLLASYEQAYHRDPYCEPPLWHAFGDNREWKESDRAGFDRWVAARPRSWMALTARGLFWEQIGYQRRGRAAWSETPPARQKGFDDAMKQAEKDLRQAIALEPRDVIAAGLLIDVLRGYGDTKGALAVYHAALAADPVAKGVRGRMLLAAEPDWGGSVALMKEVLAEAQAHEKQNPRLEVLPAYLYDWAGSHAWTDRRYSDAVRYYRAALQYFPGEDGDGWRVAIARVLHQSGDDPGAIRELGDLLGKRPGNTPALVLRSKLLLRSGQLQAALADAEKAVQLEPGNAGAWSARASANVASSQWEAAEEAYAEVAALSHDTDTQVWALEQRSRLVSAHPAGGAHGAPATAVEGVVQHLIAETESSKATTAKQGKAAQEPPRTSGSQTAPSPASPQP